MSTSADLPEAAVPSDFDVSEVADANDLRDTAGDPDDARGRTELPLEADPADVAEQDAAVPYDDEER
jgi:hypothetical protein